MKSTIYKLMMMLTVALFIACSEDEGTDAGSDAMPMVTIYQYTAESPYNADNDTKLRFAVNNKVESLYYLSEETTEQEAHIASLGENGYKDYVMQNGTKVEFADGQLNADVVLTGMLGSYTITAVAVSGGTKNMASTTFVGIDWMDFKPVLAQMNIFTGETIETKLQYASIIDRYRVVDPWGTGVSIVFAWDGGRNVVFDNSSIATGWMHPNYGEVTFKPSSGSSYYWAEEEAFVFTGNWTVAAGSFGTYSGYVILYD